MPTTVFFRDRIAGKFRPCKGGCGRMVLPPKHKCPHCKVTKKYTVIEGRPINKGRNAKGTCLHRPDKIRTKRAKKQRIPNMPLSPDTIHLIDAELKFRGSRNA